MNKITAVIIEDEIPAARRLNNTLNELRPEWQITVLPGSVKKSVEWKIPIRILFFSTYN